MHYSVHSSDSSTVIMDAVVSTIVRAHLLMDAVVFMARAPLIMDAVVSIVWVHLLMDAL